MPSPDGSASRPTAPAPVLSRAPLVSFPRRFCLSRASAAYFARPAVISTPNRRQVSTHEAPNRSSRLRAAGVAMSRPPLPRAALTGEDVAWSSLAASLSSPLRQVPQGFEDSQARRGNEMEFANDMSQGSYFTNLLVSQGEESQDHPPTMNTPIDHGGRTAKGSQGRTKNFGEEEDKLLLSAWLNVGMDPIKGVDQLQTSYWARIHDYFHANKSFPSDRSQGSLMNRWSTILHDVNLFCGCVIRIQDRNQSGCSIDDKIAAACTMFTEEDKKHRKFALIHCWRILKDKPKWIDRHKQFGASTTISNKKQKTKANSSPSSAALVPAPATGGVDAAAEDPSKRPDGKKTEKKKLRQRSTIEALDYLVAKMKQTDDAKEIKKEQRCNKVIALQEEKIKLEREKFEFQRDMEDERILSLDVSNMTYRLQQYYEGRQDEILARHCC